MVFRGVAICKRNRSNAEPSPALRRARCSVSWTRRRGRGRASASIRRARGAFIQELGRPNCAMAIRANPAARATRSSDGSSRMGSRESLVRSPIATVASRHRWHEAWGSRARQAAPVTSALRHLGTGNLRKATIARLWHYHAKTELVQTTPRPSGCTKLRSTPISGACVSAIAAHHLPRRRPRGGHRGASDPKSNGRLLLREHQYSLIAHGQQLEISPSSAIDAGQGSGEISRQRVRPHVGSPPWGAAMAVAH